MKYLYKDYLNLLLLSAGTVMCVDEKSNCHQKKAVGSNEIVDYMYKAKKAQVSYKCDGGKQNYQCSDSGRDPGNNVQNFHFK